MPVLHTAVSADVIDADALTALVDAPTVGAVACFRGQIRDHDPEAAGEVTGIDYTHHPDAAAILAALVARVAAEFDPAGVARLAAVHRVGRLDVGDLALVVCVGTPHRREAFALCEAVVERVKAELPIWKQQFEADGRAVWSSLGLDSA